MRNFILIQFGFICFISASNAQTFNLTPDDIYGIEIKVKNNLMKDKCDCCSSDNQRGKCELYLIDIERVIYNKDTNVYKSMDEFKNIHFLVGAEVVGTLHKDSVYTITANNSCAKEYLILGQIIPKESVFELEQMSSVPLAMVVDLRKCLRLNIFKRFLLILRINRENIYKNAPLMKESKHTFLQKIYEVKAQK